MKKRIFISLAACLVIALVLSVLQLLVVPKYIDNAEGNLIGEYYAEAGDNDVIFIGDCEIYESFVPSVLWEEYGITSYLRGSAQQLVWQSYYLLEETFKYETPKVVVFNVLALKYGEPQNEAYNRMTLDGMRWSSSKVGAINASMTEDESFVEYLFPLLRFHSRITALTGDDIRYIFERPTVSSKGYLMQTGIVPMEEAEEGRNLLDYDLPESSMEYLDKMRELCEENGSELILVKAPTNYWAYWWYDEWEAQVVDYAEKYDLAYYNLIPLCEEIGIDWSTDTYDAGAHLNVYGAEKTTRYFGNLLAENHGLADTREDEGRAYAWGEVVEEYKKMKNEKEKERDMVK